MASAKQNVVILYICKMDNYDTVQVKIRLKL